MPRSALRAVIPGFLLVTPLLAQAPEPAGALQSDLACGQRVLIWNTRLAITADGQRVAWKQLGDPDK